MIVNNKKLIEDALREFYSASIAPLQTYQAKLKQIRQKYDDGVAPLQAALDAAEGKAQQKRTELYKAKEEAVPELKAQYDAAFKDAWSYYDGLKQPYFQLRESSWKSAEGLFRECVKDNVAETDDLAALRMGLDARLHGVKGDPSEVTASNCTKYAARDLIQELFLEALKPLDKGRDAMIKPTEVPYRKACDDAVASLTEEVSTAHDELRTAEEELRNGRTRLYTEMLQARVAARKELELALNPLKAQLKEAVQTVFENLAQR